MSMSPEDIIAHSNNMTVERFATYYVTPINHHTTQLRNIHQTTHDIPTNKLSDIHAILRILYPNKHYYLKYKYPNIQHNIFDVHTKSPQPNIIDINHPNQQNKGYYVLNTDRIAPVNSDNISIQQALDIMEKQIQAQSAFMRLHPNTIYGHKDCRGTITICGQQNSDKTIKPMNNNIYISYRIYNQQHNPNINIQIGAHNTKISPMHYVNLSFHPNAIHDINTDITNAYNDIVAHIHEHAADYFTEHGSQHQRITLLHAINHYFAQPNNPLHTNIHQALQNFQQYYTYQS